MEKTSALTRFWQLVNRNKSDVGAIYFYAILNGFLQLGVPIGVQAIIGLVLGAAMITSLYVLIVLVVLAVFMVGVLQLNQMKIIERIQQRIFTYYAFDFIEKLTHFDLYKADQYYLPDKANRFFDTLNLQKGFSKLLLDIPAALIQILFGLVLLTFYHPFFIAFGFILVVILWIVLYFTSKKGLETSIKESNYKYDFVAWMQEVAKFIKSFKLNEDSDLIFKKADGIVVNYLESRTSHFKILLFQYRSLIFFKTAVTAVLLGVGCMLLVDQKINIGEFIAAEIVILSIIASVEKVIKNLDTVYDVLTAIEKLASVTEHYSEKNGTLALKSNEIGIELNDFTFAYPNSKKIFSDVQLKIPARKTVCIIGEENSGKSTLLKLLSTYYLHFEGNFLVNNIPINNYKLETLRDKIGIFFQERELFSGTILENITLGREDVTPEDIIAVAKQLEFDNLLLNLPLGFQTPIDINGKHLTSSIAKKIILLRALVHQPHLVLLEEPWLGLKQNYKTNIMNYIINNPTGATIVITSRDRDFAMRCDCCFELIDGKFVALK